MLHRRPLSFLAFIVLLSVTSTATAQEKLRLAWAGFSPTNSPIWVIEDRKLLQKMGVIAVAVFACLTNQSQAAISVGPAGSGLITFDSAPLAGDWSTRIGADQWSPSSVDRESAIFDAPVGLKRRSCQAA